MINFQVVACGDISPAHEDSTRRQRMVCFVCIVEHSSIKPTDCRDNLHSLHKALHTIDCTATPPAPKWMCAGQAACERAWHRASQDARGTASPLICPIGSRNGEIPASDWPEKWFAGCRGAWHCASQGASPRHSGSLHRVESIISA